MARARKFIDVSQSAELLRVVQEVQESGEERVLTRDDEELAALTPLKPADMRRPGKSGLMGEDDLLWDIV